MTKLSLVLLATLAFGCATPQVKSPCPGLWCISVAEIPGPKLCYDTQALMLAAQDAYTSQGYIVKVVK